MTQELRKKIEEAVELLEDTDDCVGIELGDGRGLFIQVVDECEGTEYFIELNDVVDGSYEPCAKYNVWSEFGDTEKLIKAIDEYLADENARW